MKEFIAVVPENNILREPFKDKNFLPAAASDKLISRADMSIESSFIDKDVAEGNKVFVQLVTYTVVINPAGRKLFLSKRISGDTRLKDTYCIGFGGHVNKEDFYTPHDKDYTAIDQCARRELKEELYIIPYNLQHIGTIRNLSSDCSEHLGFVYIEVTDSAAVRETDSLEGKWVSYDEFLKNYYSKLESWSKSIFDYLYSDQYWSHKLNLEK